MLRWKQHTLSLAALIALIGAASMVVFAILGPRMMSHLVFNVDLAFRNWHVWTPISYALVNAPSLWTLFGCYLLWSFGEAVERHLGRPAFMRLVAMLLAASPLIITLLHLVGARGVSCAGINEMVFGVFIAFATLYPRAKISIIILTLDAWVMAAIFIGINALQALAARDWISLLLLAGNVGTAYAFIRYEKGEWQLPSIPKPSFKSAAKAKPAQNATPNVDDILEKISRHGMQSLTAEERRVLDQASDEMKRRAR